MKIFATKIAANLIRHFGDVTDTSNAICLQYNDTDSVDSDEFYVIGMMIALHDDKLSLTMISKILCLNDDDTE